MHLKRNLGNIIFTLLLFFSNNVEAKNLEKNQSTNKIKKISIANDSNLAIYLTKKTRYKIYSLPSPDRLVVEIQNAKIDDKVQQTKFGKYINKIKFSDKINSLRNFTENSAGQDLLINFFLTEKIKIIKTEFDAQKNIILCKIEPLIKEPALTMDSLIERIQNDKSQNDKFLNNKQNKNSNQEQQNNQAKSLKFKVRETNKVSNKIYAPTPKPIIVIDAGHGGKDPGTIGVYARSKEKNITLSYAKELAKTLMNKNKYKVLLTRDNDYFIPLDKRVEKSRRKKADLFISLHANSTSDNGVSGFSIYTLSEKSSDKKAELLAQKENQADIINGIDFSGASKDITKTLIDLSQRESKNSSAKLAKFMIYEAKKAGIEILQNTHRFAGFMVLTAPDMASVLIELGYLSNKKEEEMLNSLHYRRLVAKTLALSIDKYFNNF